MPKRWWLRTDFDERVKKKYTSDTLRILMYSLALLVAYVDYRMGFEFGFSLFYLLPIVLATKNLGTEAGFLTALFSTALWLYSEHLGNRSYAYAFIPYCNAVIRFGFFWLTVLMVDGWETEKIAARMDILTKIANRRAFEEFGQMEVRRCKRYGHPFSLIYIDVDNFKTINDRFGHREGDQLLATLADTLMKNFRETDFVARLGGDEFGIVLVETPPENAQIALKRCVERLMTIPRVGSIVTLSIGLATYPKVSDDFEAIVKTADELMYRAKSKGKNRIEVQVFPPKPVSS